LNVACLGGIHIGMNDDMDIVTNPVERYVACFETVTAAASAAGISSEMLRRMRKRGFVTTRKRALVMARACGFQVDARQLLALSPEQSDRVEAAAVVVPR
jgi:hypothetical protein